MFHLDRSLARDARGGSRNAMGTRFAGIAGQYSGRHAELAPRQQVASTSPPGGMPTAVVKKKVGTKKAAAQKAVKKAAPRGRGEGGGVRGRGSGGSGGGRLAELPQKRSGVTLAELSGPSRGVRAFFIVHPFCEALRVGAGRVAAQDGDFRPGQEGRARAPQAAHVRREGPATRAPRGSPRDDRPVPPPLAAPAAQRRPRRIALPVQPPCGSHSPWAVCG